MRSAFTGNRNPSVAPARRPSRGARALYHVSLAVTFATAGGALMVWPQWIAMDGARTAFEIQQSREKELSERLDVVRGMQGRLRSWDQEGRRVMLPEEAAGYPTLVQAVARREGAQVLGVKVTNRPSPRWRSLTLHAAEWSGEQPAAAGEIRPRSVRVLLTGSFDSVFRSVASLGEQQLLFIPDRWSLVPLQGKPATAGSGATQLNSAAGQRQVRAEVWATVFVVEDPAEKPKAPLGRGPLATNTLEVPVEVSVESDK